MHDFVLLNPFVDRRSASFHNTMYTITTLPDGSVQLNALSVIDFSSDVAHVCVHIDKLSSSKATRRLNLEKKLALLQSNGTYSLVMLSTFGLLGSKLQ
jgi:hypothetical protein